MEERNWPNFGDGPAHLQGDEHGSAYMHGDERWQAEAESRPPNRISLVFAGRDKNGLYPPGSFQPRPGLTPEDLADLGLNAAQAERVIQGYNQICAGGPLREMYAFPFTPWFAQLDDELKEWGVQLIQEHGEIVTRNLPGLIEKEKERERMEEERRLERESRPPEPSDIIFAPWDRSDPDHPKPPEGAFEIRANLTPEDLQVLNLTPGQVERLIEALRKIYRQYQSMGGIPWLSPEFPELDDELKEQGIQFFEGMGAFIEGINTSEEAAKRRQLGRQRRMESGWGTDPMLN